MKTNVVPFNHSYIIRNPWLMEEGRL